MTRWYPDKRSHLNQNLLQICKNFKAFHYQSTFFFKTITWEKQTYYDTLSQNIERYEARSFLSKVWKLITFQVFTHFVYYVKIEHLSLCFYLLRDRSAKIESCLKADSIYKGDNVIRLRDNCLKGYTWKIAFNVSNIFVIYQQQATIPKIKEKLFRRNTIVSKKM